MPFDGAFTHIVINELKNAVGCRVEKIYQPCDSRLIIHLSKRDFSPILNISVGGGGQRIYFTSTKPENPINAPMFCMLCRKYFSSSKLVSVEQKGLDRVVILSFEAYDEMGDIIHPQIVCELFGSRGNVILVNKGKIIDALFRSDIEKDIRLIQPGADYLPPQSQNKINIFEITGTEAVNFLDFGLHTPLSKEILSKFDGLSPLIAGEIVHRGYNDDVLCCDVTDKTPLIDAIDSIVYDFKVGLCYILYDDDGKGVDFTYTIVTRFGNIRKSILCDNACKLLEKFYSEREQAAAISVYKSTLLNLSKRAYNRAVKRRINRINELNLTEDRDKYRIYGELIKANLYLIKPGSRSARVVNYYDEGMGEITVPLDEALSPQNNSAKYFKIYRKLCNSIQTLSRLIKNDDAEMEYLTSVIYEIEECKSAAGLNQIQQELTQSGYIKEKKKKKSVIKNPKISEYTSKSGFKIYVGKNNIQNDYLTTSFAGKTDIWLHTKNIHGSHVIIKTENKEVDRDTLLYAACLAAYYSSAKGSAQVPVDYTHVKYVKKPNGAKPGMVTYTTNKTVYVTPVEDYYGEK